MVLLTGPNPPESKLPGSIALQTRAGRDIANSQLDELTNSAIAGFVLLHNKYSREHGIIFRAEPSLIYNCHGMTFASRRTTIYSSQALKFILEDDGYKEVAYAALLPGDIIMYFDTDGDFEHSGIILKEPSEHLRVPIVFSKWGKYREVIHPANNCPYNFRSAKYYRCVE